MSRRSYAHQRPMAVAFPFLPACAGLPASMSGCCVYKLVHKPFVREIAPGVIGICPEGIRVAECRFGDVLPKPYLSPALAPDGEPVTEDSPFGHLRLRKPSSESRSPSLPVRARLASWFPVFSTR